MTPTARSVPDAAGAGPVPVSVAAPADIAPVHATGGFVTLDGETCYRIAAVHRMPPFLMSIASDTDLWLFVTSRGGLTAGRRDPDGALFPYETEDRLYDGHHHTGPITLLRVGGGAAGATLWEPFSERGTDDPRVERNLYKNIPGNRLVFEEVHHGLEMAFRYRWSGCDEFGLVRTATLENLGGRPRSVSVLDGLRNVLPFGVPLALLEHQSGLVDAYKRVDLDTETGLAIVSLTSRITDRPLAAEALRANTVWQHGLAGPTVHLSLEAVDAFRRGESFAAERVLTGRRANVLVSADLALAPRARATWHVVADVGADHLRIEALRARLRSGADPGAALGEALDRARDNLRRIVASADGLQLSAHAEVSAHHAANVLFNGMRGGVFAMGHDVPVADVLAFMRARHRDAAARHEATLRALPARVSIGTLRSVARESGDPDFVRLAHEYLPLFFGRRHGDPSRPWNRFEIRVRNADGSTALEYQGNWRDIFQNWEALAESFPAFLPNLVARFVNASTLDGYNPYRITREGVDWEVPDPKDPWSHIGYWGDHQIVYLLRLLEALERHAPGALGAMLGEAVFSYANVPYRLKPYEEIVADPKATIRFDAELAERIAARVAERGGDGRLVHDAAGRVLHATLAEKLLVPALSKLSSFVPDGGIWMNTQRPEWNDANNALAGHGVSVVTLFHLRRYLRFLERLTEAAGSARFPVAEGVVTWLRRLHAVLERHRPTPDAELLDGRRRKELMDALGEAFAAYRAEAYARGPGAPRALAAAEIAAFCRPALAHVDHAIRLNRRGDDLYHSYNVLELSADRRRALLRPLDLMLEGQVAALGSGLVDPPAAARMVERLFESPLYRPDQKSFMLYPEKTLPGFLERNVVPERRALAVPLLRELLAAGDATILARDAGGTLRFHGDFTNALDLDAALDRLAADPCWSARVTADRRDVLDVFEAVFRHHAFTGRSGAMYAYEGLGCVYWHMVAKLQLAVLEAARRAAREGRPATVREALARGYRRIRAGLGFEKTVVEHGAFPTDPYSHTPPRGGARQPGMTGQVKEGILARFGELGVDVEDGVLAFRPLMLERREFLATAGTLRTFDLDGAPRDVEVPPRALAFTVCQVPIVYELTRGAAWLRITRRDGTTCTFEGDRLDAEASRAVLGRTGEVTRIDVGVPEDTLPGD
uniref:Cellobiose phosphorylase n=1 Tax=Eiseniibacteriota bacterium TaxID=2212470 RepID=A0A832I4L2_UNCEI